MRRHAAVRPMEAIPAILQASVRRVRRMVAPLIIAIRTAAIRTAPVTETTAPAIRVTTIVRAATGLSIPAIKVTTTVPAEMAARIIAPATTAPATTARATIIVLTTVTVLTIAPIIAPDITIRTGHPVRVIVLG